MTCVTCGAKLDDPVRFCGLCGAPVPEEAQAAVDDYAGILRSFLAQGELQGWHHEELTALRSELGVRQATHDRLLQELGGGAPAVAGPGLEAWVDASTMEHFRVGERCLVRFRVRNGGKRALGSVELALRSSASTEGDSARCGLVGPGMEELLSVALRPQVAGQHQLEGLLRASPLRGEGRALVLGPVALRVVGESGLQQVFNIDARSQRVGVWENLGQREQGGLIGEGRWHAVGLRLATEIDLETWSRPAQGALPGPAPIEVGQRLTGTVKAPLPEGWEVETGGGQSGLLRKEELSAPLQAVLTVGNRLTLRCIGVDHKGRPLLSERARDEEPEPPAAPPAQGRELLRVGPGEDLAGILAPLRSARVLLEEGVYAGPLVVAGSVELVGVPGTVIESRQGPCVEARGEELLLRNLVLRGAAPRVGHAPDGVLVRAGRVVLEDCEIATNQGNFTRGRGVALQGPRTRAVLERCHLHGMGVGVAVDVNWTGFATDEADGASATLRDCRLVANDHGAQVAGAGRALRLRRCTIRDCGGFAVRALRGGEATVQDCALAGNTRGPEADAESSLMEEGNRIA